MAKMDYRIETAVERLAGAGCKIRGVNGTRRVEIPSRGIGIKAWGAADYLAGRGYRIVFQEERRRIEMM